MNVAIIAAAGQGTRFGGGRAKQFLELEGIPIIIHTLRAFERCEVIHEIIVVVAAAEAAGFSLLADQFDLQRRPRVVSGGRTRAESVLLGLREIDPATVDIVVVHDGARPFVTVDEITRTVAAARLHQAAVLVAPISDTIKEVVDGKIRGTLSRSQLRRALTPQCFAYRLLLRAYDQADVLDPELTDDSALVEALGQSVAVVEGSPRNIKITTPEDLAIGAAILSEA
jgi:2-C-methyl-D-erythritol 4-phosphate cytidylyltransferase